MKIINKLIKFLTNNIRYITSFLTVGIFSAVVNFAVFGFFWNIIGLPYQYSVSIAYILSVICHFTGNRNITFKNRGPGITFQIAKYLIMVLTNYLITLTIVHAVVEKLYLSPYIGIILAIGITVWTGFLMSKFWVFQQNPA
jgi:putative flippase GtrA